MRFLYDSIRTYSCSSEQPGGFGDESVDERLAPLPVVDRYAADVAAVTEGGQRRVQEKREQRPVVLLV